MKREFVVIARLTVDGPEGYIKSVSNLGMENYIKDNLKADNIEVDTVVVETVKSE